MLLSLLAWPIAAVVGMAERSFPARRTAFQLRTHRMANLDILGNIGSNGLFGLASNDAPMMHLRPSSSSLALSRLPNLELLDNTKTGLSHASWSTIDSLKLLRGGSDLPLLKYIPVPSTKTVLIVSTLFASYVLFLGFYALVAPVTFANSALKGIFEEVEEDSFSSSQIQSIGAIVIGLIVHVYLALSNSLASDSASALSLGHAMGYSLLPRILLIAWSFFRSWFQEGKGEYQFQGTSFLKINFFMMAWAAFSLLTGAGNPVMSAKVFSTMALIKAMALVLNPVQMTQKIFGVDVAGKEMTQSCFLGRALGSYLAVHAILMLSLACGVDTNVAVGTALLAWTFLPFWILTLDQKSENGGILGINDNVQR